ncbi:MAG: hypothetical protein A2887_05780 [Alphaproteobacteria bacterium RIFCSPLOWO2_01_FULL_40_26]|nr:MAG: hypothetical protein A3D15_02040 [Alphaproteobacteria bacterium RIFCSPHIGHO2_02_FULL_40_34]OFW86853.1 MAG: hypothetical protein A2794_04475 [Alphaproteobacteria bacterium RIFCSPHIGHO2_01_FULL_40_8]OFW94237.1 MAG: hypothetical protein A2887_05780 [Alphaproteobacteria bacterium RIFCSPLOWO2_01_FULL_40_26]OFX09806.1 MAG: hypothetical protein A3H30_00540 [Alphaproteobacteria bacterium RIFCSPLOWO2_02_FULL_40_19]OFX12253.1 MAG: hypothetical protein A3G22_06890 [Alphaproteobacteria bacterium RI
MPQFDFTTYSSQIFWFLLCFITLYLTTYFVILPRIRDIIAKRRETVDSDILSAKTFDVQIEEIHGTTTKLRKEAQEKYQSRIEEIARNQAKEREKSIEELKEKIDEMTKKSRQEIKDFTAKAQAQGIAAVQNLVHLIKAKISN